MKRQPEKRIMSEFLFLPKSINGKTKWLVIASWEEERIWEDQTNWFNPILGGRIFSWSDWKPTKFI